MNDYHAGHILGLLVRFHALSQACHGNGHGDWCVELPLAIKKWMIDNDYIVLRNNWDDEFRLHDGVLRLWMKRVPWDANLPSHVETSWSL